MKRLTSTKIFLDGGDPKETAEATRLLNEAGFEGLDGQTTNPSLVAKNPDIAAQIERGEKLMKEDLLAKYKEIVQNIEKSAPGAISIEVYADENTTAQEMVEQAREMGSWIQSAVVKLPTTEQGLLALEELRHELRLNMTLCFSQQQAAAIYAASRGSAHPVFVSPFVGRLDDAGFDGTQHIANVLRMYHEKGDGHTHVLAASFRRLESVLQVLHLGTEALTINFKLFEPWAQAGFVLPDSNFQYESEGKDIPYEDLDLSADWRSFNIQHDLTDTGLQKFATDWNSLLQ